jgi:hypothetical protein
LAFCFSYYFVEAMVVATSNWFGSAIKTASVFGAIAILSLFCFTAARGYGGGGGGGGGSPVSTDTTVYVGPSSPYPGVSDIVPYLDVHITVTTDDGTKVSLDIDPYVYPDLFSVMVVRADEPGAWGESAYVISFIDSRTGAHITELNAPVSVSIGGLNLPADTAGLAARIKIAAVWASLAGAVYDVGGDAVTVPLTQPGKVALFTAVSSEDPATDEPPIDPSHAGHYDKSAAMHDTLTINTDKGLFGAAAVSCASGTLLKGSGSTVYYCGRNGKRYVFVNPSVYFSWYDDYSGVETVDDALLARIPVGGNVTYRPGFKMVKIQSDPRVYVVSRGGLLRWVQSEEAARMLYGDRWNRMIDDISDAFFVNYRFGADVTVDDAG